MGCGPDKLPYKQCQGFDVEDGDANHLSNYFKPASFNYLHASQTLEDMLDPVSALRDWVTLVKPKGHIIFTVPDWVLYEGLVFPSRYNGAHKSTWSLFYRQSNAPIHCYIPKFLAEAAPSATVLRAQLADNNYDYKLMTSVDQTIPEDGAEAFIEVVLAI